MNEHADASTRTLPTRTILDCDTDNEVDDQFAIAYALGLPEVFDLLGVVSVHNTLAHGPRSRDRYQREAERVVELCGSGVACVPGAERPMETVDTAVRSEGLEFIARSARDGPLTLVCTGPATDVASLALEHPELCERLRVVWLGGFGDRQTYEEHKRGGELNGRADIAAWRRLFTEPVELLLVPGWSGPHELVVEADTFSQQLRDLGRPITDYLAEILETWVSDDQGRLNPRGRKILWDIACIAAIADPGALQTEPLALPTLDAAGAHDFSRRGRQVEAVVGLDPERVLSGCTRALERHGTARPGDRPAR